MKRKDVLVLWRIYFDSTVSRREGRRLPLKETIPNPTLEELIQACQKLKLVIAEYREARYPRVWWRESGYVMIKKDNLKKRDLLRLVAKELRRIRS